MKTLLLALTAQLLTAYIWYPLVYRLLCRLGLPAAASSFMYERHRAVAYLAGVGLSFPVPWTSLGLYWGMVLLVVPVAASMFAAVQACTAREPIVHPLDLARLDRGQGRATPVPAKRGGTPSTSASRRDRRKINRKS